MTHIIYSYRKNTGYDTLGQSWAGESVDENVALCKYQTIEPFFLKHLPRNGKILEAGCGLGRWVIYLREKDTIS